MMRCDVCEKPTLQLTELVSIYKTEAIKELCPECEGAANKHLRKLQRSVTQIQIAWMKRWLARRKHA